MSVTESAGKPVNAGTDLPKVRAGFLTVFAIQTVTMWLAMLAPVIVTLPIKVQLLVGPEAAPGALAAVLGVSALFALIGNPLFGRISDRTTSRFGRRKPWLLIGAIGGILGALIELNANDIPTLLIGASVFQLFTNAILAASVALVPDQVPASQRGAVSGLIGIGLPAGTILGVFIVQIVAPNFVLMFMLPPLAAFVGVVLLLITLKDRRITKESRPDFGLRDFIGSFWVNPRRFPDFGWAWWSRFFLFMGLSTLVTYQAFVILNKLGMPAEEAPKLIFFATLMWAIGVVVSSIVSGKLSDKLGLRKVFVGVSAAIYGLGLAVIAFTNDYQSFLIGMVIAGLGQGAYLAVDLALVTDVLPNKDTDAAKDLGVFNIATAFPQSLAPAIAPIFLAISGPNNYVALFVAAACFALVGAFAILPVKGVK